MSETSHAFPALYCALFPELQEVARAHGYALALHGSLTRDMDIIAVPWTAEASEGPLLVDAIRESLGAYIVVDQSGSAPGLKPHGRLAYTLMMFGGAYIDLSVMPITPEPVT